MMWQGTPQTFEGAATATTVEGAEQADRARRHGRRRVDQAARDQRRRLLRAELDASVREPDAAVELHRDVGDHDRPDVDGRDARLRWWAGASSPSSSTPRCWRSICRWSSFAVAQEAGGNPAIAAMGVDQSTGSMEGKEVRFGAGLSALWAVTTTATSNGSVNAMHDSLTPLGGLMPLVGMWLNNIFGGVGVGFINMLIFVIVAVFVAGMMIGRTPEFLGKKVEAREMKLASLALLWHPLAILVGTAVACYVWATTADPGDRAGLAEEPRPARLLRDALRVHVRGRQQRLGLRGAGRQHAVLEHLDRRGDAAVALHPDHRAAGAGRVAGRETGGAGNGGLASRRQRDVRHHAVGGDRDSRPADVHAGRGARPDRRAPGTRRGGSLDPPVKRSCSRNSSTGFCSRSVTMVLSWRRLSRPVCGASAVADLPGAGGGQPDPPRRRHDRRIAADRAEVHAAGYFHPRPSAVDYNAASTGGSNYGPSNPDHLKAVRERLDAIATTGARDRRPDSIGNGDGERGRNGSAYSAGRGRPAGAARGAAARGISVARVRELIAAHTEPPALGFLGRARVNVLELNLALDEASAHRRVAPSHDGR